jgi:hypothetical protein
MDAPVLACFGSRRQAAFYSDRKGLALRSGLRLYAISRIVTRVDVESTNYSKIVTRFRRRSAPAKGGPVRHHGTKRYGKYGGTIFSDYSCSKGATLRKPLSGVRCEAVKSNSKAMLIGAHTRESSQHDKRGGATGRILPERPCRAPITSVARTM